MMRLRRQGSGPQPLASGTTDRRYRLGSRRLAVSGVAAVALAGTAAGVAVAGVGGALGGATGNGPAGQRSGAGTASATVARSRASAGSRSQRPVRRGSGGVAPRTSCRSVAQIGDSTSVDLISSDYLTIPAERLGARYSDVGVRHLRVDASGGRSIVESMPGQVNGYQVAAGWRRSGYRGCWVFALGTNDTANVAAGSSVGPMARINQMIAVAHGEPVMWVNTRTMLSAGPWANANEQGWDDALRHALARYPNMTIFDWSAVAQPSWFLPDGIHYNTVGCAKRAKAIADALARAFPLNGHGRSRIVR